MKRYARGYRAEQILSVPKWSVRAQVSSVLPFCLCSSDLWGGLGGRDAAAWAVAPCSEVLSVHKSSLLYLSVCVISSHTQVLSVLPFCLCFYLFTHKSSQFYPSVCVLICSHTSPLCSTPLGSYLFTHKSSLFYPSVCLIHSHTSPLCPTLLSVFLSVHTQFISVLPFCLCSYLFAPKSLFYPSVFLTVHAQVIPVLPICVLICSQISHLCSTLLSVCVLICSHTNPCSTPLSVYVLQIFEVDREGETQQYEPFKALHNRQLLWHGSRTTNFAGILSQGLRIAPPEAPVVCRGAGN